MDTHNFFSIGSNLYLFDKEVVVVEEILGGLVAVCYHNNEKKFYIDKCALTKEPNYDNSISLGLFGKRYYE